MSDPTANLERAISAVYEREQAFGEALQADADAEYEYEIAYATALLSADGANADTRKAQAVLASQDAFKKHLHAKATKKFCDVKLTDAQNAQTARQSLLSRDTRTQFGSMGRGA